MIRSLDPIIVAIIAVAVLAPAVVPLLSGKGYDPRVNWRTALWVAVGKCGITAVVVGLLFTSFSAWLAELIGEVLYLFSMLGLLIGVLILLLSGFWSPRDPVAKLTIFLANPEAKILPPSAWHVLKWSLIGAVIFILAFSVQLHPGGIAKQMIKGGEYRDVE